MLATMPTKDAYHNRCSRLTNIGTLPTMVEPLPIEEIRPSFEDASRDGPVVISAPTGSGKSTRVPVWCSEKGRVLVIEPRRVACRSLALRLVETEGGQLGEKAGYIVRDDRRATDTTLITFVTPGVALRILRGDPQLTDYSHVVLDEFHERGMETDLLLALLKQQRAAGLVVMSATIEGDRLAEHLAGRHIEAKGRLHPVSVSYRGAARQAPTIEGLEDRVLSACAELDGTGHTLVFLPGKGEIRSCHARLREALPDAYELLTLHGGLTLKEQSRIFAEGKKRKVILTTNVAETSLTVPGVTLVVDSGLVRRTRYRGGRGFLTLSPIAQDSADQRSGRAGRTTAGRCVRLWSESARLEHRTPPEIFRESLVPLVFNVAAVGASFAGLSFLDIPKAHALETARVELQALGAIDGGGVITQTGADLFGLPLDVALGRLLVEARGTPCFGDMIDLVAVLMQQRSIFMRGQRTLDPKNDLRADGCDILGYIRALRSTTPKAHLVVHGVQSDAKRARDRLHKAFGHTPATNEQDRPIDRKTLAMTILSALPKSAYIARPRKRDTAWANGGTELRLGRETALAAEMASARPKKPNALIALETRALGRDAISGDIVITCAMPIPMRWLKDAGLGREHVCGVKVSSTGLVAQIERKLAGKVIETREGDVRGDAARQATLRAMFEGKLWRGTYEKVQERLNTWALYGKVHPEAERPYQILAHDEWLLHRLEQAGLESGSDVLLLNGEDLLPELLGEWERGELARIYPMRLEFKDVSYRVEYDIARKRVSLHKTGGRRRDPPPRQWLPRFQGFKVFMVDNRGEHPVRN